MRVVSAGARRCRPNPAAGRVEMIAGFVVQYRPAGQITSQIIERVLFTREQWNVHLGPLPPNRSKYAEWEFGVSAPWSVTLTWECGEDAPPT
jgi:hypothetical protein